MISSTNKLHGRDQFCILALVAHELNADEIKDLDFSIKDGDNMPIDDFAMIRQWKNDSSFKIFIDLKVSRSKIPVITEVHHTTSLLLGIRNKTKNLIISLQSLHNFITKQNQDSLFDEHEMLKFLSPQSRRSLIKCLVQFINDEYSGNPTNADITNVCHATINLFSFLKVEKSDIGGIVRILLLVFVLIHCSSESNMNEWLNMSMNSFHFLWT